MTEQEAIRIIAQFVGWTGLLALTPLLGRLAYAFSYYLTGRLKKRQKLIVQFMEDGVVIREKEVFLDVKAPIVEQLDAIRKGNS